MPPRENLKDRARKNAEDRQAAAGGAVAVPGNGQPPAIDPYRQVLDPMEAEIAKQLPKLIDPDAFMRTALTGMKNSKQAKALIEADRSSLYAALLESARLGLMPFTDEGAIVVFGKEATFIPQWQGYVQLFYRTGQVARVVANLIYQRDEWELAYGDTGGFYHRPALVNRETGEPVDRGQPVLAYCYLVFRDGSRTEVTTVTRWEAEETMREHSRSWQNAEKRWRDSNGKVGRDSAWHTDFPKMWRKTAIRRHAPDAPKSPELIQLLLMDRRDDSREAVRAGALPPMQVPALPPMPEPDQGVDWSKDVNSTVTGTVVPDDDPPPPDDPPAGGRPRRQASADPARRDALAKISAAFAKAGLDADDNIAVRQSVLTGMLAPEDGTVSAYADPAQVPTAALAALADKLSDWVNDPEGEETLTADLIAYAGRVDAAVTQAHAQEEEA